MVRLTKRVNELVLCNGGECSGNCMKCRHYRKVLRTLCEFEEAVEDGSLISRKNCITKKDMQKLISYFEQFRLSLDSFEFLSKVDADIKTGINELVELAKHNITKLQGSDAVKMFTTFAEKYINGEVTIEDIETFIKEWHLEDSKYEGELNEYLGLTDEEYELWAEYGKSIEGILEMRK